MIHEPIENINKQERDEKIRLITRIMATYLHANVMRPEGWHGEKFDYLYDMSVLELRILDALCKKN